MSEEQIETTEPVETTESLMSSDTPSSWRDGLPEDIANHSAIKDIGSVEALAKSAIHAQQMVGADKVIVPGRDADQAAWGEFYNKIGRPDQASEYELPTENMPENSSMDEQSANEFMGEAHRLGLTKGQFAGMVRYLAQKGEQINDAGQQAVEQSKQEAVQALQQEFGAAFDQNLKMAKDAVRQFGGEELVAFMDQSGMGNQPEVIKAFAKIGKMIAEDEVKGKGGAYGFIMSPDEAAQEIQNKQLDNEFMRAYLQSHVPGHDAAVTEMQKLFELANPEQ